LFSYSYKLTSHVDQSIEPTSENPNAAEHLGTLSQLKEAHDAGTFIWNALDLPMPIGNEPPHGISTDREAFRCTLDGRFCGKQILYPSSDMSWGLAATSWALSYFHVDADGFLTWVKVKGGSKYWVIARPRVPSISAYAFHPKELDTDKWDLEAVLLQAGDLLYVQYLPRALRFQTC
jgi:hypothetical protein